MAIIGAFTAWGNSDVAIRALRNHLKVCDKIFASIEAHSSSLEKFEDDTFYKVVEISKDTPVKIIPHLDLTKNHKNPDHSKCTVLNYLLRFVSPGDVLMLCDSDEFYGDEAITEIKEHCTKTDWDFTRVHDMFFYKDLDHYVKASHGRFWRIKPNARFLPTQNMMPAPVITRTILESCPMFHISMLGDIDQRREFWIAEERDMQVQWLDQVYQKWDVNGDNEAVRHKNYITTGVSGPWVNKGPEDNDGDLFVRDFDLPDELLYAVFNKVQVWDGDV